MSSNKTLIDQLNLATTTVSIVVPFINFLTGGIGSILNIIVFSRPTLRGEPCSLYFILSSCFSLFVVLIIIPVRIASDGFNRDLANYNIGICKTETFAFYIIRTISFWFIVLACFDRYLHSSPKVRMRQMSSLKTAKILVAITSIFIILLYCHMVIYNEILYMQDRLGNLSPTCVGQTAIYRTFIVFWFMSWYSLCPSFLMFLFGFLTLKNLRQAVRRAMELHQRNRRRDNQLLRMLIAQVLIIVVSTLPFAICRLYLLFTMSIPKDTLRRTQENLIFTTTAALTYFAHSSTFYFYTLTGTVFRKELMKFLRRYVHRHGIVLPAAQNEPLPMFDLRQNPAVPTTCIRIKTNTNN